ncbi:nitroreductase family deazaflavin-dependent oxidoreductase [Mycobacterium sp. ACS4331]|uniref:nitroreductase family deazaflavin-dependent oxidoreductase n=1 Tax=Mycobacterium sp. ACS4331 TaxID=1834121 RepID=UPI000801E6FF|nr:nitroreductase family deazaflavin-dependent oxidoreductase [Mycobacterium sp. ACS4331]OBF13295.1 deazaflavin-dependent nitroreductase [Mycobacterium sp. ACS4331]
MSDYDSRRYAADAAALSNLNAAIVEEFRSNGGRVGGPFEGSTLVLLHTTGAKTGKQRMSPLAYVTIDGRNYIVGSFAGAPKDPAWTHNLRANPRARIEIGTDEYDVQARELPKDERDIVYAKLAEMVPTFAAYQAATTRVIPLFELVRV